MEPVQDQPQTDVGVGIGRQLRYWRKRRNLTIEEVARHSRLSKGFISQLERDLVNPSVASLILVCEAVRIPVGALFTSAPTRLIRRDERPLINFGGERISEWLLSPDSEKSFQAIETVIAPGGGSGTELFVLESDAEWIYIVEGTFEMRIDDTYFLLHEGDTLTFSPRQLHSWRNPSSTDITRALWVLVPPEPDRPAD
jgi:transcriptional regulator with XRE-family HTH domain